MMDELTRIALVGTSKHAAAGTADTDHPAESLVAQLAAGDREHAFLLRAGVRAVFESCGRVARTDVTPVRPCPAEACRPAPQRLVGMLRQTMAPDFWDIFKEFLAQLAAARLLLPPELLPQALAINDAAVRAMLLPVLGERARWLSELNEEWRWVTTGVGELSGRDRDALERQWEEGTIDQRCRALRMLRQSEPAVARQWLQAVLDKEDADHRARLVEVFEAGLTLDDEPLLESLLDGRSDQVRRVAAGLLARLPDSALSRRMQERAGAMFTSHSAGLLRKKLKLACQPPEEIDKSWERDGVPRKVPTGRGKRAVWTETICTAVPPAVWSQRFAAAPHELIEAILEDDFAEAVLAGWTQAAATFAPVDQESRAWLRPLWNHFLAVEQHTRGDQSRATLQQRLQTLLQAMPDAEDAMLPVLQASAADASSELAALPALLPRPWSDSFARTYLTAMRNLCKRPADNRACQWVHTLTIAGRAVPPATFDAALAFWEVAGTDPENWYTKTITRAIMSLKEMIQTRRRFYKELATP